MGLFQRRVKFYAEMFLKDRVRHNSILLTPNLFQISNGKFWSQFIFFTVSHCGIFFYRFYCQTKKLQIWIFFQTDWLLKHKNLWGICINNSLLAKRLWDMSVLGVRHRRRKKIESRQSRISSFSTWGVSPRSCRQVRTLTTLLQIP